MSTIDLILNSLRDLSRDKTHTLDEQYRVHSQWLQNELALIRKIVQQDPRQIIMVEESVPAPASAAVVSAVIADSEQPMLQQPKKRKSSETSPQKTMLSPEQKRASHDFAELLVAAGLPADANKLKKEQLLAELEKRGCKNFSMKNKKETLVDALKDCLVAEKREQTSDELNHESADRFTADPVKTSAVVEDPAVVVSNIDSAPPSVSLPLSVDTAVLVSSGELSVKSLSSSQGLSSRLSDFRSHLQSQATLHAPSAEDDSDRYAAEFKNRYRASQIRKSQVTAGELDSPHTESDAQETKEQNNFESTSSESVTDVVPEPEPVVAEVEADKSSVDEVQETAPSLPESTPIQQISSMDICSPQKSSHAAEDQPISIQAVVHTTAQESSESVNCLNDSVKDEDEASISSVQSKESVGSSANQPIPKKNGLQSSSSDKSMKVATSALEKAKSLKAVEEQKAQLKKAKEVETKGKTPSTLSKFMNSPIWNNKSAAGTATTATKSKPLVSESSGQQKTFLQRLIKNTKETVAQTTEKPFDVSVVDSKKEESPKESPIAPVLVSTTAPVVIPTTTADAAGPFGTIVADVNSSSGSNGSQAVKAAFPSKANAASIVDKYNELINNGVAKPGTTVAAPATPVQKPPQVASSAATTTKTVETPSKPTVTQLQPTPGATKVLQDRSASVEKIQAVDIPVGKEYPIDDRNESDDDAGTDDEEENRRKQDMVPEWAKGPALREALEKQFGLSGGQPMDPDLIFPEVITCSLEEIFGQRQGLTRKYANRTSSAHWEPDQLTLVEKRQYRNHMGYSGQKLGVAGAASHVH